MFHVCSQNGEKVQLMPKRTKLEGKMDFLQDQKLEMAKKLGLDIREPKYSPETYPEGKMAQPGVFIFNEKQEVIYKYVKTGGGPWGRPLPQALFPAIAKHVETSDKKVALKPIPEELLKDVGSQDKEALATMESDLRQKGALPE
mmetsp:Transcript_39058/g.75751  ORF Transcript_39058/g.75751 Transcript_39058/m.75751 type:complete len:144 (-) Transcript_39058:218-649(-)